MGTGGSGLSLKFILQVVDQASPAIAKVKSELAGLGPAASQVSSGTTKAVGFVGRLACRGGARLIDKKSETPTAGG